MDILYKIYDVLYTIINKVTDINTNRLTDSKLNNRQWIYPTIPTSVDKAYPRITIQILNLEEVPISAGGFISDNFSTPDLIKEKNTGNLYYLTIAIRLFIKREDSHNVTFPDGSVKLAKNTLQSNLLFQEIISQLDSPTNIDLLKNIAFYYKPYNKEFEINYEDDVNRLENVVTLKIPILSKNKIIYNDSELINKITQNYTVT